MIRTDDKTKCCGCETCRLVCPTGSISFRKDVIGSNYPTIDETTCINCNRCSVVCPIQGELHRSSIGNNAYIAYSNEKTIRTRGSSGGIFETAAKWILSKEGVVFASKFDENLQLKCTDATCVEDVQKLTKSKYLQCDAVDSFPAIKEKVVEGKPVLYCATPCLISALKQYLGSLSEVDNLYLLDFFCHGVPSQWLFDKCREYVEKKKSIKITDYEFRSKKPKGVTPHYYTIKFEKNGINKEKTALYLKDPFYLGFQKYITLRDSCYHCPYGDGNHCGDFTIGDCHNVDRYIAGINRFEGVSTVLINNDKGETLWNSIKESLVVHEIDIDELYEDKEIYVGSTKEPEERAEFIEDMKQKDLSVVIDKWFNSKAEWKKEIYYGLPRVVRKSIKRFAGVR